MHRLRTWSLSLRSRARETVARATFAEKNTMVLAHFTSKMPPGTRCPQMSQMPLRCPPDASQMPPRCLPDASQMPPRCLPDASWDQMPPDVPDASQMSPRCPPDVSQMPPRCLPADASQMPPRCLPADASLPDVLENTVWGLAPVSYMPILVYRGWGNTNI